jgi:hypothetical protein
VMEHGKPTWEDGVRPLVGALEYRDVQQCLSYL